MKAFLGLLGSACRGLWELSVAIAEAAGGYDDDDEAGYAGAGAGAFSTSSDSDGYGSGQVGFLAPAEHNGFGTLADFTLPDSNDWSPCDTGGGGMFDD